MRDDDCERGAPHQATPGNADGTGVYAERRQYLHRVASTTYATERALVVGSDRTRPCWNLRLWGFALEEIGAIAPPVPASPGSILAALQASPLQALVSWSSGNVKASIVVDLSGDSILNFPPAVSVQANVIMPSDSAEVNINGQLVESGLQPTGGPFVHSLIQGSLWSTRSPIERSRNRMSQIRNIARGVSAQVFRIPSGAQRVTLYTGPQVIGGAAPTCYYTLVGFVDPAGVQTFPIGELAVNDAQTLPGLATAILITADPVADARVCATFELE